MELDFNCKNVIVTGATRGIGAAVSIALAAAGANVLGCFRNDEESAERLRRRLKEIGGDHHIVRADVTKESDVDAMVTEFGARCDRVHALVNNAALISHVPFAELSASEWHRVVNAGLFSAHLVTQRVLPLLRAGSSVINVGSRVATVGVPLRSHYAAAKAGLTGLTRSLAKELGSRGIRVNLLCLGVVCTDAAEKIPPERLRHYESMIALGRLADPNEVASVVLFLASDHASYITGATLAVDGGM